MINFDINRVSGNRRHINLSDLLLLVSDGEGVDYGSRLAARGDLSTLNGHRADYLADLRSNGLSQHVLGVDFRLLM